MKIIKTAQLEHAEQQKLAAPNQPTGNQLNIELHPGEDVTDAISQHLQETGAVHIFREGHGYEGGFHDMGHNYELNTSDVTVDYRHSGIHSEDFPTIIRGQFLYKDPESNARVEVQWRGNKIGSPAPGVITYSIS